MLPSPAVAALLVVVLTLFVIRSAYDSLKFPDNAERERISVSPLIALGMVGLASFFLLSIAFVALTLVGEEELLTAPPLGLSFGGDTAAQLAGAALLAAAFVLIFWGFHEVDGRALTTTGPYRWVRHPIYLGYFLAFAGFFLLLLNLFALLPLLVVPAQMSVADAEEDYLASRFPAEWERYKKGTGKYLPLLRK